ncbi:MAG: hypothetical protein ILNGONEN_00322 [Syntrophorhabdaceae bacterium]|nr:hypothetical protein [Syntrophorhabdaceae bacterium]
MKSRVNPEIKRAIYEYVSEIPYTAPQTTAEIRDGLRLNVRPNTYCTALSELVQEGLITRPAHNRYHMYKEGIPQVQAKKTVTAKNKKDVMSLKEIKEALDWLFSVYIPHLERENKDLYNCLVRYGAISREAKVLYYERRVID